MLLPSALGSSPHPPVSVYGTGTIQTIAAFLDAWRTSFPTSVSVPVTASHCLGDLPPRLVHRLARVFRPRDWLSLRVPTVLSSRSTGISTCCPSATAPALALGPDSPRADQLYPGNLGYSAIWILTIFSLLIPAFSLPCTPRLLTVTLHSACNAPLPMHNASLSFGGTFQPRTFSAQDLSTSELLRTL